MRWRKRPGLAALAVAVWLAAGGCARGAESQEAPPAPRSPQASPTAEVVTGVIRPGQAPTSAPSLVPRAGPVELGAGQHLSAGGSYLETETEAAGPMVCQIRRGSCAFRQLIGDQTSSILFSGGEAPPYNDEDRLMHPAMLLPLTRLAELVEAEWGGAVQVMVTEAYDSQSAHDLAQRDQNLKYSLHFEGRSVDVIPWPPAADAQRLARMCALAHQAGFDWVHNEGDHCHASVRADSLCYVCSGTSP